MRVNGRSSGRANGETATQRWTDAGARMTVVPAPPRRGPAQPTGGRLDAEFRPPVSTTRAHDVLARGIGLAPGDVLVHIDHGIGRFEGLETLHEDGWARDFFRITYRDGKVLIPVENADLLTRYGSAESAVGLDRLGGTSWQTRKARLKHRIGLTAKRLIGIAAKRELATAPVLVAPPEAYAAFCARFPFEETPDQAAAIAAVLADLASGKPMDRLVCGDVGSGKTEVALRAAFHAAMAGRQVAVVVPTTLLSRQHTETFRERFRGFPVSIAQASRLTGGSELAKVKEQLRSGEIRIVIGTHALLVQDVEFANLGLIVIDEEQRFGVQHKERLKQLREGVHVLTLTATPIPRTLQLALSLVRSLSLIITPPAGRLPVRTTVCQMESATIGEALIAEKRRGGQSFYVCPRISDLDIVADLLRREVPEVSFACAHGQMAAARLDTIMGDFLARRFDVLVSTTIIESGLDIPTVNTLIVHDAHRLGLAQLYQLRGRIGRSRVQACAYLTIPPGAKLTAAARRRLDVLTKLDSVGAGFAVASHDMDIRGAGNLIGEEQSGHIREVGFELYQTLLKRAVEALRRGEEPDLADAWAPRMSLGLPLRIPESYIPDAAERAETYWRLAGIDTLEELTRTRKDLESAHGPLPLAARRFLATLRLKQLCREARVAELKAGPKGAVLSLRPEMRVPNRIARPRGLKGSLRLRKTGELVVAASWSEAGQRVRGVASLLASLARAFKQSVESETPATDRRGHLRR
jgi:transcription-repair coupling factor (superfamily II helicase)